MNIIELADKNISEAQIMLEGSVQMKSMITEYGQEKYNEGFQSGKDSIQLPDPSNPDVIYTQQQMNDAVTAGKEQQKLETELELGVKISELQAQVDAVPGLLESAKSESVAAFKAELKAKYEEQQVVESSSETGFKSLLE
jgi:hypothetical protein